MDHTTISWYARRRRPPGPALSSARADALGALYEALGVQLVYDPVTRSVTTGIGSDGGVDVLRELEFQALDADVSLREVIGAASVASGDETALLTPRLPDGRVSHESFRHEHPEWAKAVRTLGYVPTVVSFGAGLLPDATPQRRARHAQAGGLLGGLVPLQK